MSPWPRPHPLQLTSKCVCAHLCVCLRAFKFSLGGDSQVKQRRNPVERISNEKVRLIWPARGEIQQLCLDMMNCMCRTRVFTEQTTERQKEKKKQDGKESTGAKSCSFSQTPCERAQPQRASVLPSVLSGGLTRTTPRRELKTSGKRGRQNTSEWRREREAKWEKCTVKCEKETANEAQKTLQWFDNRKNA